MTRPMKTRYHVFANKKGEWNLEHSFREQMHAESFAFGLLAIAAFTNSTVRVRLVFADDAVEAKQRNADAAHERLMRI